MNQYMQRVLETVKKRNAGEPEFIQTVEEVFKSLEVLVDRHPEYEKMAFWNGLWNRRGRYPFVSLG